MKRSDMLLAILVMQIAMLTVSSSHRGYYHAEPQVVIMRNVMHDNFKPCAVYEWKKIWSSQYICVDNGEVHGEVYKPYLKEKWSAYGWGLVDGEYATEAKAKEDIERQTAYWMRPILTLPEK